MQTLNTLLRMKHHAPSGMYYNWYDEASGEVITTWPDDGSRVYPFLSSVDNGWLAAGLYMVANAEPSLRAQARTLADSMDFGFFYDAVQGQLYGGAWTEQPNGTSEPERDGYWFTSHRYGTLNTEPRIASYIGIAQGRIPP